MPSFLLCAVPVISQRQGHHTLHVPEARYRFAKSPIAFRSQRSVNRGLHDGHAAEFFAEHELECDEDTVV